MSTPDDATIPATVEAGAAALRPPGPRAFLAVYVAGRSRIVDVAEGGEVTLGRSSRATIVVPDEQVSRVNTRIRRVGEALFVEDLASRNGTFVNGQRISGERRVHSGDEVTVGCAALVVGQAAAAAPGGATVRSFSELEERLAAELDRARRYKRAVGLVAVHLDGEDGAIAAAVGHVAAALRRMDTLAQYGPQDLIALVPEAEAGATAKAAQRLAEAARASGCVVQVGSASSAQGYSDAPSLLGRARAALRTPEPVADGLVGLPEGGDGDEVVVIDPATGKVFELAERVAPTSMSVLLLGETGVGKEIVAAHVHRASGRGKGPLVRLSCAALPATLLESELFGHERGAFTGADKRRAGYFEVATGGTLFLDEIGEMPLELQAKLLRVLEDKKIARLGASTEISVEVRVIAATNRDLEAEVRAGRFREDLYFRLSAFVIPIPPLRQRRTEIVPLAEMFSRRFARELGVAAPVFSPAAVEALRRHDWPGNVRELRNTIERALVLSSGGEIGLEHLGPRVATRALEAEPPAAGSSAQAASEGPEAEETGDVRSRLAELERHALLEAMAACGGNQTRAAQRLGLSRRALIYKLEKHGLKRPPGGGA